VKPTDLATLLGILPSADWRGLKDMPDDAFLFPGVVGVGILATLDLVVGPAPGGVGVLGQVQYQGDTFQGYTTTGWVPFTGGGGGGTGLWIDDGTNLKPATAGRGINLGAGNAIANSFSLGTPGAITNNGGRLHIEGPNGVEVVGLMLKPIGAIFPVAGTLQWTGTLLQFYDGTQWVTIANTGGPPGGSNDATWVKDTVSNNIMPANLTSGGIRITNRYGSYATGGYLGLAMGTDGTHPSGFEVYLDASSTSLVIQGGDELTLNTLTSGSGTVLGLHVFNDGCIDLPDVVTSYPTPTHERLSLTGGIKISAAIKALEGTIQYSGGHFLGRLSTGWVQLDNDPNPVITLPPTGVTPGLYGDGITVPQYNVHTDGRLYVATNVPIDFHTGIVNLGPASGDVTGTYPILYLIDLVPPIPAGTWGDATHLPTFTIDTKGRVTHATHTLIRGARDPMARVLKIVDWRYGPPYVSWSPNTRGVLLTQQFTPLATGRGYYTGSFGCWTNRDSPAGVNAYPLTYVQVYFYLDGVLQQNIAHGWRTWVLDDGTGEMHITFPFWFPWTASVGDIHEIRIEVSNYKNATETVDPSHHMILSNEWSELGIEEDAEPGVGTNSSYLLAGAIGGPVTGGVIGSWVAVYTFTLPGGLGGSWGLLKAPAGTTADFPIQVNGVIKGNMHWTAGSTLATFSFPSAVTIAIGDLIEIVGVTGITDPTWTLRGIL